MATVLIFTALRLTGRGHFVSTGGLGWDELHSLRRLGLKLK